MSKTVERVMKVMLIGLVAMLGAKVEAHWVVVKGRCYWHSGECVRKDKDDDGGVPFPDPISLENPIGELVSTPIKVEILCPGKLIQPFDLSTNPTPTTLTARKPIVQGDVTKVKGDVTDDNVEWSVVVSDAYFLENPKFACPPNGTIPPLDVIIRSMAVEMNLYLGFPPDIKLHSTWEATTCTLSDEFKFNKKVPPRGAPYACVGETFCHEGICQ